MTEPIRFETPENIEVSYQAAGLGTRFVAWFVDIVLITAAMVVLFIIFLCSGIASEKIFRGWDRQLGHERDMDVALYFIGLAWIIVGLGNFAYFVAYELWSRGQTVGKRMMRIRVVKADGFSLDAPSIFVRNIFRIIDHLPILWIVPLVTQRGQRLGDLAAGTLVIVDEQARMEGAPTILADGDPAEAKFRFDANTLRRAQPEDMEAVERILGRWNRLSESAKEEFLTRLVEPLANRLKVACPDPADRLQFLEEFLAAEYRFQHRNLG